MAGKPQSPLESWFRRTTDDIERRKEAVAAGMRDAWQRGEDLVDAAKTGAREAAEALAAAEQLRTAQEVRMARSLLEPGYRDPAPQPSAPAPHEFEWERLPDRGGPPGPSPGSYPPLNDGKSVSWPLPGRYEINRREARTHQGDGNYGYVRWKGPNQPKFHKGLDIAAPTGTPVITSGPGRVIKADGVSDPGGYGLQVVIEHPNGLRTQYAHLSGTGLKVGDEVLAGEQIGLSGKSGNVREAQPHLHFEVRRDGQHDNPWRYLDETASGIDSSKLNPSELSRLYGWD